jgi:hypothetical protein
VNYEPYQAKFENLIIESRQYWIISWRIFAYQDSCKKKKECYCCWMLESSMNLCYGKFQMKMQTIYYWRSRIEYKLCLNNFHKCGLSL